MSRLKWAGIGAAVLAVGAVVSSRLGSAPEAPTGGPLAPCGPALNCARVRAEIDAPPAAVRQAVREALAEIGADGIEATGAGWTAAAPIGPFTDDVDVAVEAGGLSSVLWVRSASRVGKNDLGVNARRVRRLVEATRRRVERAG